MPRHPTWIAAGSALLATALLSAWWFLWRPSTSIVNSVSAEGAGAEYVGSSACKGCHAGEYAAWEGSQHARAMQHATVETVLGNFEDARFTHSGVTSRFFKRDGRFFVRTDGPDGRLGDYEVKYTFGVKPLQQYLVELPGGRLQALSISWDSRTRGDGGQRWFHLYPDERIDHRDELHWTKPAQNWNFMCADCHSTNVRKGYDEKTGGYVTTWSDIAVGCEACHGPGSHHVSAPAKAYRRVVEGRAAAEMESCTACHSRRAQFAEGANPGDPLMDHYIPTVLGADLYHVDGQQQGEVFIWGSYVQSRKHAAGVTCGACHEPHTQKLRLPGNAVCTQCHAAAEFDVPAHHHHPDASPASECLACHMRQNTYMVVDRRRDHGFHIPRPDLSLQFGTPNACNDCHADRSAAWAAKALAGWRGGRADQALHFAEALYAGRTSSPGAVSKLLALLDDDAQPPIVRASALELLASYPGEVVGGVARSALSDPDPLVRHHALLGQQGQAPERLAMLIGPMLRDPVRANRHEAARQLAIAGAPLDEGTRALLTSELADFEKSLRHDLSRGEAWVNLGNLQAGRNDPVAAENSYRSAIRVEPGFIPGWINLADLLRAGGREAEVEALLRDALQRNRNAPAIRESLGLSLVRQGKKDQALREFATAHRAAPEIPRFRYVYALALHDAGLRREARSLLDEGLQRQFDRDAALALAAFAREEGDDATAARVIGRLREVNPGDPALAGVAQ